MYKIEFIFETLYLFSEILLRNFKRYERKKRINKDTFKLSALFRFTALFSLNLLVGHALEILVKKSIFWSRL